MDKKTVKPKPKIKKPRGRAKGTPQAGGNRKPADQIKPSINLTVTPSQHKVLKAMGRKASSFVRGLLDDHGIK